MESNTEINVEKTYRSVFDSIESALFKAYNEAFTVSEIKLQIEDGYYALKQGFQSMKAADDSGLRVYEVGSKLIVKFNLIYYMQQNELGYLDCPLGEVLGYKMESHGATILDERGIYITEIAILSKRKLEKDFAYYRSTLDQLEIPNFAKSHDDRTYKFENKEKCYLIMPGTFDWNNFKYDTNENVLVQIHFKGANVIQEVFGNSIELGKLDFAELLCIYNNSITDLFESLIDIPINKKLCSVFDSICELDTGSGVQSVVDRIHRFSSFTPNYKEYAIDSWYKDYLNVSLESVLDTITDLFDRIEKAKNEIRYGIGFIQNQMRVIEELKELLSIR